MRRDNEVPWWKCKMMASMAVSVYCCGLGMRVCLIVSGAHERLPGAPPMMVKEREELFCDGRHGAVLLVQVCTSRYGALTLGTGVSCRAAPRPARTMDGRKEPPTN